MTNFNAKRARAKRPCPIWVDAFQRDTQHLGADEVGAYFLILMAMWTRESCDLPNDDGRLAKICRVSLRLWKARIGPALLPFFIVTDEAVASKRLRIEAAFIEKQCQGQSDRRAGSEEPNGTYAKPTGNNNDNGVRDENAAKPLNNNDTVSTVDSSTDQPRHYPTQLPNVSKSREGKPSLGRSKPKPARFDEFWAVYPHRGGVKQKRQPAEAKYEKLIRAGVAEQDIIDGAKRAKNDRKVRDGFARDPTTWLNQSGWEDEIDVSRGNANGNGNSGNARPGPHHALMAGFAAAANSEPRRS